MTMRGGFIGTGIMGGHMVRKLSEAGFDMAAWNRSPEKTAPLKELGIEVADTAAAVAKIKDFVICMLSSGPVCDEVLLGEGGVIDTMQSGSTLIVMSSIPVETARRQAEACRQKNIRYIDAPVSGGEKGAREGTLAIMAGGDASDIAAMQPVFAAMGRLTPVGPIGSGQLAKLANQMIVASSICTVAEALLLAERGGADPGKVREALLGGFADSTILRQHGLRMVTNDFVPGGSARYQLKDTNTALSLAAGLGLHLPIATGADRLFAAMVENGDGDLDHSAIIEELRRMNA